MKQKKLKIPNLDDLAVGTKVEIGRRTFLVKRVAELTVGEQVYVGGKLMTVTSLPTWSRRFGGLTYGVDEPFTIGFDGGGTRPDTVFVLVQ